VFLADDIVLFPVKSILSLFREIYKAAVQEMADEADSLRNELGQLYLQLESGAIDETAFDSREQQILDRLDAIEARDAGEDDEADDEDVEEEEEDDVEEEDEEEEDDVEEEDEEEEDEDDDES